MTDLQYPALRQIALKALAQREGSAAGAAAVADAAQHAYDDLTRVAAPLIGQVGIDALTGRSLYLLQRNYQWLAVTRDPGSWAGPFAQVISCVKQQTPAVGMEATGAMLATLVGLVATLIGEPLTTRLLQEAWPDAFASGSVEERRSRA